jgi:hypothetical protein
LPHVPASESFAIRPRFRIPHTIAFCAPFVFMVLRIAFPATPFYSHLYKLPGGCMGALSKPSAPCCQSKLRALNSSSYELFVAAENLNSFVFRKMQTLWAKHPGWGALTGRGCSEISLLPRRQNRCTAWQVAACPAGCHNSPLHTKHLARRLCLVRRPSLLLMGG